MAKQECILAHRNMERQFVKLGDFCSIHVGNGSNPYNCEAILMAVNADESFTTYRNDRFYATSELYLITSSSEVLNLKYLYYQFCNGLKRGINHMASKQNPPHITLEALKNCTILLPPLEEQLDLVRVMDAHKKEPFYLPY